MKRKLVYSTLNQHGLQSDSETSEEDEERLTKKAFKSSSKKKYIPKVNDSDEDESSDHLSSSSSDTNALEVPYFIQDYHTDNNSSSSEISQPTMNQVTILMIIIMNLRINSYFKKI